MRSCVSKRVENSVHLAEIISGEMRLTGGRGSWLNGRVSCHQSYGLKFVLKQYFSQLLCGDLLIGDLMQV